MCCRILLWFWHPRTLNFHLGITIINYAIIWFLLFFSRNHTDDGEDEQESAMTAAKGKLLSKIVKKNILENIVPILIELKHLLEKHRSPLLKYLMMYLKELLKDFKSELQDIVVGDKQLAKELEYPFLIFNIYIYMMIWLILTKSNIWSQNVGQEDRCTYRHNDVTSSGSLFNMHIFTLYVPNQTWRSCFHQNHVTHPDLTLPSSQCPNLDPPLLCLQFQKHLVLPLELLLPRLPSVLDLLLISHHSFRCLVYL